MPLNVPEPPIEAFNIVRTKIQEFANRGQFRTPSLSQTQPRLLNLTAPHPVYTLTLEDIVQQRPLEVVRPVGWRYLIQQENTAIASAEVLMNTNGSVQAFSQFNEGPYVGATVNTIVVAEGLSQVAAGSYELRALRIPALYVMALWLKDTTSDQNLILPMPPVPSALEADRTYTEVEFMTALEGIAQQQQQFDNSPRSS